MRVINVSIQKDCKITNFFSILFSFLVKDVEAAYHITDIHEALALSEVGNDRKMFLFGTQVTENGSEIPSIMQDARDLIAQLAADMQ